MHEARQRITDALTKSRPSDRETALLVLGHAVRWAADALREPAQGDPEESADGADALTALYALDEALTDARVLGDALPGLLEAARAGKRLGQSTRDLMDELTQAAERVARERAALDALHAREAELRRRLAEHEKLRHQADELRRLEQLVTELDALRVQRTEIDGRLRELRAQDPDTADRELRAGADSLLSLTEQQLAVLAPRTRQSLEHVAAAQRTLADTKRGLAESARELATLRAKLENVRTEHAPVFDALARHARADGELARALRAAAAADGVGPADGRGMSLADVVALTESVEQRLAEADRVLSRALTDQETSDGDGEAKITSGSA
ncbi:hypothetical protein ACFT7S_12005 [Streptomyces sp. NPDC057136]|uniref:hypothetical protein n=1 Tax=Streptomyces sp. NPDC057136 TaxID=3346029 RepID=UPI00363A3E75